MRCAIMPCCLALHTVGSGMLAGKKCGYDLTSRPTVTSVAFLNELCVLLRYPPNSGAALLEEVLVRPGLLVRFLLGVFRPLVVWLISLLRDVFRLLFVMILVLVLVIVLTFSLEELGGVASFGDADSPQTPTCAEATARCGGGGLGVSAISMGWVGGGRRAARRNFLIRWIQVAFEVEDKGTGTSEKITVTCDWGRLTEVQIVKKKILEAEQFADEDMKVKERVLTPRMPSVELQRSLVTSMEHRGGDQLSVHFHVDFFKPSMTSICWSSRVLGSTSPESSSHGGGE